MAGGLDPPLASPCATSASPPSLAEASEQLTPQALRAEVDAIRSLLAPSGLVQELAGDQPEALPSLTMRRVEAFRRWLALPQGAQDELRPARTPPPQGVQQASGGQSPSQHGAVDPMLEEGIADREEARAGGEQQVVPENAERVDSPSSFPEPHGQGPQGEVEEKEERTRSDTINELNKLAKQAKGHIIKKDFESAIHPLADELKRFSQEQQHMDFIELIDVYFVLADAYIELKQLKRAERYLSTGYTVFFKIQEETLKASKGTLSAESQRHLNNLRATLCKMIGKLKKAKADFDEGIKQFAHSIYLDSLLYGPENYRLT